MRCTDCHKTLDAYIDGELSLPEQQNVRDHLATCAACAREHDAIAATVRSLREGLMRHAAPDTLKASIRANLAAVDASPSRLTFTMPRPVQRPRGRWVRLVAAGMVIAAASSVTTLLVTRPRPTTEAALLSSHVRSLMSGHLTDVASTNKHNVKPWFSSRIDFAPPVPGLETEGFPLVGGRLDRINGRQVAVVVYTRGQHVIDVYSWPSAEPSAAAPRATTVSGYHFLAWRAGGLELQAVSNINFPELEQFVAAFQCDCR